VEHLEVAALRRYSESLPHYSSAYKPARTGDGTTTMASTTTAAGSAYGRVAACLLEAIGDRQPLCVGRSDLQPLRQAGGLWLPLHTEVYTELSIYYCKSFFFSITDRDCVALPNVDISMSTPLMDEVAVACPPARNNSDARGRAIYVGVVVNPGGGTTHACPSPPPRRCTTTYAGMM
jgi:hypothetical protein